MNLKKVLIMSGTSGLGLPVLNYLLKENYFIYLTVHTEKELTKIKQKYTNKNVLCLKVDILNDQDLKKIALLDIDVFISFVAICNAGSIIDIDIEKLKENFDVNVFSYFKVIQIVLKKMIYKKGKIILLSSLAGNLPFSFSGPYASTKASIDILSQTLRKELKYINKNIKVILIKPGFYKTGFNQYMFNSKYDNSEIIEKYKLTKKLLFKDYLISNYLEKKNFKSITNKIIKAIKKENPKKVYQAPFSQMLFSKFYQMFK